MKSHKPKPAPVIAPPPVVVVPPPVVTPPVIVTPPPAPVPAPVALPTVQQTATLPASPADGQPIVTVSGQPYCLLNSNVIMPLSGGAAFQLGFPIRLGRSFVFQTATGFDVYRDSRSGPSLDDHGSWFYTLDAAGNQTNAIRICPFPLYDAATINGKTLAVYRVADPIQGSHFIGLALNGVKVGGYTLPPISPNTTPQFDAALALLPSGDLAIFVVRDGVKTVAQLTLDPVTYALKSIVQEIARVEGEYPKLMAAMDAGRVLLGVTAEYLPNQYSPAARPNLLTVTAAGTTATSLNVPCIKETPEKVQPWSSAALVATICLSPDNTVPLDNVNKYAPIWKLLKVWLVNSTVWQEVLSVPCKPGITYDPDSAVKGLRGGWLAYVDASGAGKAVRFA